MAFATYDNDYLIHLFVTLVRAHPLGQSVLKSSEDWRSLGLRGPWIEHVAAKLLEEDVQFGTVEWGSVLNEHAHQYREALAFAPTYALQSDEVLAKEYLQIPYELWTLRTNRIGPIRLTKIIEAAEALEATLEAYSDF